MQNKTTCQYCGVECVSDDQITEHLTECHDYDELSRIDQKRVTQHVQKKKLSRLGGSNTITIPRRKLIAALGGGIPAGVMLLTSMVKSESNGPESSPSNQYYGDPSNWESSGPDTHSVSNTDVFDDGVNLTYDSDEFNASYEFSTTAQETIEVEFDWNWRFCHSFYLSDAKAFIFADTSGGEFEEKIEDSGGCTETKSGAEKLDVYKDRDWGVRIQGSHGDSRKEISGRFALNLPVSSDSGTVRISDTTISDTGVGIKIGDT